jgi:hypothetical protein
MNLIKNKLYNLFFIISCLKYFILYINFLNKCLIYKIKIVYLQNKQTNK